MSITKSQVENALKLIIDPELGINIVALGLIYNITINPSSPAFIVEIEMTLTTPGCPLAPYFIEQVPLIVSQHLNLSTDKIKLNFTFDPPWTRDLIDTDALAELGLD